MSAVAEIELVVNKTAYVNNKNKLIAQSQIHSFSVI